jgi:hypothetical protein
LLSSHDFFFFFFFFFFCVCWFVCRFFFFFFFTVADPLTLTEEQLMGRKKDWLIAACDKLSIQCNRGATKSVLANAIVAFGAAQKAKKKTVSVVTAVAATPARVAAAIPNIFQRDRTSPISPPAQINGPPPAAVRLDAASTPRLAATRAVPSTVAVANRRGRSPARTNRERSASVGRGAAPAVLPQQLAAPPPVNVPRVVAVDANNNDDENDEFVEDRSPSPAPRRVSATRGVSPARVSREPRASFVGGDRVAASERAAHRRWIAQIVAVAVVVLGLIAWFVLGTPTPPGEVAASEALQRLREAHGAFLCDPQAPYQFTAQQLFGNLAPEDRQRAEAMLAASSEAVDTAVDAQSKHTLFSAKAAFATPTLGCRFSLFTSDNWPLLFGVGVIVAAALALVLRAQQASSGDSGARTSWSKRCLPR